jgi:hypothetical protein
MTKAQDSEEATVPAEPTPPTPDPSSEPASEENRLATDIAEAQTAAGVPPEETSGDRTRLTGELEIARQHALAAEAAARDAATEAALAAELEAKALAEQA